MTARRPLRRARPRQAPATPPARNAPSKSHETAALGARRDLGWGAQRPGKKTRCGTTGARKYVVVRAARRQSHSSTYGRARRSSTSRCQTARSAGRQLFEPRYFATRTNSDFRGVDCDARVGSTWTRAATPLQCEGGDRTSKLEVMGAEAKRPLLLRARYEPYSPHRRKP